MKSDKSIVFSPLFQEFKFMGQCRSPSVSPSRQPESTELVELSLFEQYLQGGNPFEMQIDNKEEETEDVLASNGVYSSFSTSLSHSKLHNNI